MIVIQSNGNTATRFEHWNGELPKWTKNLRTWGESVVVKLKTKFTPKLANCGEICMFWGYAEIHNDGFYQMWNDTTNGIHVSRDVFWLKRMFFAKKEEEEEIPAEPLVIEKAPITEAREINDDSKLKASTDESVNYEASNDDADADDLVDNLKMKNVLHRQRDAPSEAFWYYLTD